MGEIKVGCVVWRCERREELGKDFTIISVYFVTELRQVSTASIRGLYS